MDENIFEEIMQTCTEKKVVSACKKLSKKSALTSMTVAQTFTELAYWLYVYGHVEETLKVCEATHIEPPEPFKINYNVWTFILPVWGLEAYIWRKRGIEIKARFRIKKMKEVWRTPTVYFDTP